MPLRRQEQERSEEFADRQRLLRSASAPISSEVENESAHGRWVATESAEHAEVGVIARIRQDDTPLGDRWLV